MPSQVFVAAGTPVGVQETSTSVIPNSMAGEQVATTEETTKIVNVVDLREPFLAI